MTILALYLVDTALAKTFRPNCSMPHEPGDYVTGVNIRSTASIFWSVIYTIFVCTWAVQRPNLPTQEPCKAPESAWRRIVTWVPATFWTKLKWMLVTMLLPELLVGRALGDWVSARQFKRMANSQWTLIHGFYANMGGLLLQLPSAPATSEPADSDVERSPNAHSEQSAEGRKAVAINGRQLYFLLDARYIDDEPPISEAEIQDKSKGDIFAIISAQLQLLWLISQLITRRILELHSTLLEISALSFSGCAIFIYALWFKKPQNVQIPTNIYLTCRCPDNQGTAKCERYNQCMSAEFGQVKALLESHTETWHFKDALFPPKEEELELAPTIRNDQYSPNSKLWTYYVRSGNGWLVYYEDLGFVTGAVILGACHCAAWNFDFPTPIERTLWRIAAVSITSIMPLYYFFWWALVHLEYKAFVTGGIIWTWVTYTIYTVLRLYLLATAFRELWFLPPEAFVATWSVSFPHFG